MPAHEITAFEKALGVELPADYRAFLEEVGYGAGPYYGLWSPAEIAEELRAGAEEFPDEGLPMPLPARDFALAPPAPGGEPVAAQYPRDGAIPIAFQGCTFWTLLVTAGQWAGSMWDVACFIGYDGEYRPARRPPGVVDANGPPLATLPPLARSPTFVEWYHGWLERCLTDLGG